MIIYSLQWTSAFSISLLINFLSVRLNFHKVSLIFLIQFDNTFKKFSIVDNNNKSNY